MRALLLLVVGVGVSVVPIFAGEESAFERAIRMFQDRNGQMRNAGSRTAEQEVRRLLAPLIKAMKHPDPEVRRRAREAILSVVPDHDKGPSHVAAPFRVGRNVWARGRLVVLPQRRVIVQPFRGGKGWARPPKLEVQRLPVRHIINGLGLQGTFKKALGRTNFLVQAVTARGKAHRAGIRIGDVILSINKKPINKHGDFAKAMDKQRGWSGAVVHAIRANRLVSFKVP